MIIICVYIYLYMYTSSIIYADHVYIYIYTYTGTQSLSTHILHTGQKKYIIMCVCVCVLNFLYNPPIPVGHSSNRAVGHSSRMRRSTSSMSETSACQIPRYHSLSEAPWGPLCLGKSLVHQGQAPVYDSEVDAHNLVKGLLGT